MTVTWQSNKNNYREREREGGRDLGEILQFSIPTGFLLIYVCSIAPAIDF
jgi:hypothetical protein